MSEKLNLRKIRVLGESVEINIDFTRIEKQLQMAQFWLDSQVMTDMIPYMPMNTGEFIQRTRAQSAALSGTGKVVAAAPPFGRFLYEGKVMVDPETGSPWARKGAKKIVTDRPLNYSNPRAVPHWFDTAKEQHLDSWVDGVKRRMGGG